MNGVNGMLIVDKEKGITSHTVVNQLRRLYGLKKVGHTGTLDPFATGVLPMCLGAATRLSEYMVGLDKTYQATLKLGERTDTQDLTGEILQQSDKRVTDEEVGRVIGEFVGEIEQLPPMYSAIKVDGKKLYELARQGIEIERKKRRVTIYRLDILKIEFPFVEIEVHCSSGTYIRTLADDIGERLGTFAHLTELRRTGVGDYRIKKAVPIKTLEEMTEEEQRSKLIPLDYCVPFIPRVDLKKQYLRKIINGGWVSLEGEVADGPLRVFCGGEFVGIGRGVYKNEELFLKMEKVLYV